MSTEVKKFPVKKVLSIALNVFFYLLILFLLLFAIANMKKKTVADIPNIFGRGFLSVQSDSMTGENKDSFNEGDMIFVRMITKKNVDTLKVGDIVTWYDSTIKRFNTHRIVDIEETHFITQGDKNAAITSRKYNPEKPTTFAYCEFINKDEIIAQHRSTWGGAGKTLDFLMSPLGFPLLIVLPAVLILIFEGVILVRNVMRYNQVKLEAKYKQEKEEDLADLEKERERIRAEVMEELKKEQGKEK